MFPTIPSQPFRVSHPEGNHCSTIALIRRKIHSFLTYTYIYATLIPFFNIPGLQFLATSGLTKSDATTYAY